MQPAVQIDVDEASGIWRTDGLPMVYVPRHFMVNMHKEIEKTLGRDAYEAMLDRSGAKSAFFWCKRNPNCWVHPSAMSLRFICGGFRNVVGAAFPSSNWTWTNWRPRSR